MEMILDILDKYKLIIGFLAIVGIEISPIKVNPISWFGNLLHADLNKKIQGIEKEIGDIKIQQDMSDLGDVRNRILSMYRIKREGMHLTRDDISSVRHDYDRYMYLKEKYKYITNDGKRTKINGEIDEAIKNLLGD